MVRSPAILGALAVSALAAACINDRDTVASEMRAAPTVARSLTGWFDRLPSGYYQARVDRLRSQKSLSLSEQDDLAVALERLGRSDEALQVMASKAQRQPKGEDLYRLYANRGTFRIHRWLHHGAKKSELAEAKAAERDIAAAVRIKPGAHFGRESTQLEVIRWLIAMKTDPKTDGLGMWLLSRETEAQSQGKVPSHAVGLAGLISLGAAWESIDAAAALALLEDQEHHWQLADFARFRVMELQAAGKKPLDPAGVKADLSLQLSGDPGVTEIGGDPKAAYQALRKGAEARDISLTDYVNGKLARGEHPDTTLGFWDGWKEPAMPDIPEHPLSRERANAIAPYVLAIGFALEFAILAGAVWFVWRFVDFLLRRFRSI